MQVQTWKWKLTSRIQAFDTTMGYLSFQGLYRSWHGEYYDKCHENSTNCGVLDLVDIHAGDPLPDAIEWTQQLIESASSRRKFRIWEETQGTCIYCGKSIQASDFINGVDSDVEHILPQALGGGTVLENLVCSCRECNREKGDLTAMDYMLSKSPDMLSRYMIRLRLFATAGLISGRKYRALTTPKVLIMEEMK